MVPLMDSLRVLVLIEQKLQALLILDLWELGPVQLHLVSFTDLSVPDFTSPHLSTSLIDALQHS